MKDDLLDYHHAKAMEEMQRREFEEWLEKQPYLTDIRSRKRSIDFKIGGYDVWPKYSEDNHLNAINSSSVAPNHFGVETIESEKYVSEVKIHLPPAPEELQDDIDAIFDLPDNLCVFHGTTALGGLPAPDGVVTPHVLHTDNVTFDAAQTAVEQALEAYEDVYNGGEKAIQEQP